MVGKTNMGSSGKLFAVIAVTYPEGSICTCSDGTKTMKAKDTSGKALFNVTAGEWTVNCTDGTKTASKAVIIKTKGQVESVGLTYELVLFESGKGALVEFETYHDTYGTISITDEAITIGKTKDIQCEVTVRSEVLDLSEYNTLEVIINVSSIISAYPHNIGVISETTESLGGSDHFNFVSYHTISKTGKQTINIPVSSINRGHFAMGGFIYGAVSSIRFIP